MAVLQPPSSKAPAKKQPLLNETGRENKDAKKKKKKEDKGKGKDKDKDKEEAMKQETETEADGESEKSKEDRPRDEDKESKKRKTPSDLAKVNANIYRKKYKRGKEVDLRKIADKKLKAQLRRKETLYQQAQLQAANFHKWLLPEHGGYLEAEGMEKTYAIKQQDIFNALDDTSRRKAFNLKLDQLGPYRLSFSKSGRYVLFGGRKGHLAVIDWARLQKITEIQVRETVKDITFLHNEMYFAAAQKKYVYIYDKRGLEIHCCREHVDCSRLEFLPMHFLLCSVGETGVVSYQDTSTGHIIAQHKSRYGNCNALRQNPYNSVLNVGHNNGIVTMWTPNMTKPVVQMQCHRGPVKAIACDMEGRYMATAGQDSRVSIWDIRKFSKLHSYVCSTPATSLDISQTDLLGISFGPHVQVWKEAIAVKAKAPYMRNLLGGKMIADIKFCPYDDMLGIGHSDGLTGMIVPGSGEANFDSSVANPFETKKQRREAEVHMLLDKLQPDMITLDPNEIGRVKREPEEIRMERAKQAADANRSHAVKAASTENMKYKMKGRSKSSRRYMKKQKNVIDAAREERRNMAERAEEERKSSHLERTGAMDGADPVSPALARFIKK